MLFIGSNWNYKLLAYKSLSLLLLWSCLMNFCPWTICWSFLTDVLTLVLFLNLLTINLSHHLHLSQRIFQLIRLIVFLNELLFPKFILFALRETHKVILLDWCFFLELTFDLFSEFVLYSLFSCFIVFDQIISILSDEKGFTTFFL